MKTTHPFGACFGALVKTGAAAALIVITASSARAGIAYGTINNFDTVNDTSNVCHGFEIELDDCRSAAITYCYSYNHYGTPQIREDTSSVPGHTNCFLAKYSSGGSLQWANRLLGFPESTGLTAPAAGWL